MPITLDDIRRYYTEGEQEGLRLDFKRGDALANDPRKKLELVKDVSGLANADGGRLIYGLDEERRDGIPVATALSPVVDQATTKEWITQVVSGNTGPSLSGFDVTEIAVPLDEGGGRVVVIDIQAASTAHQNHLDQKYYQRTGVSTRPILDFQIRDVMNRRSRPIVYVNLQKLMRDQGEPRSWEVVPYLRNDGSVTLERWTFEIDLPFAAVDHKAIQSEFAGYRHVQRIKTKDRRGHEIWRFRHVAPRMPATGQLPDILNPGQEFELSAQTGFPTMRLTIGVAEWRLLERFRTPVAWRIFLPDARPIETEIPFETWCDY